MSHYFPHTFNVSYSKVRYSFLFYYVLLIQPLAPSVFDYVLLVMIQLHWLIYIHSASVICVCLSTHFLCCSYSPRSIHCSHVWNTVYLHWLHMPHSDFTTMPCIPLVHVHSEHWYSQHLFIQLGRYYMSNVLLIPIPGYVLRYMGAWYVFVLYTNLLYMHVILPLFPGCPNLQYLIACCNQILEVGNGKCELSCMQQRTFSQ